MADSFIIRTDAELRAHIADRLKPYAVSDKAIDSLSHSMRFLLKDNGQLKSDSPLFDFDRKITEAGKLLGLTSANFIAAALKQPQLFYQLPETLHSNVVRSAALLQVSIPQFTAAALKQPQLFCQSPETLHSNVVRSAVLLQVSIPQFTSAGLKQPSLFCRSPETLYSNVVHSAELLQVSIPQFTSAALKQPQLFYQLPETLHSNVVRSTALLQVSISQFTAAALKQPALFYQSPETLHSNVLRSAELLQVSIPQFTFAALKQPPLFYQSPETIARHFHLASALYLAGHVNIDPKFGVKNYQNDVTPFANWICANPIILCLADDNFELRNEFITLGGKPGGQNILTRPRHTVERDVASLLGHSDPTKPVRRSEVFADPEMQKKHEKLCDLIDRGILKGLKFASSGAPDLVVLLAVKNTPAQPVPA